MRSGFWILGQSKAIGHFMVSPCRLSTGHYKLWDDLKISQENNSRIPITVSKRLEVQWTRELTGAGTGRDWQEPSRAHSGFSAFSLGFLLSWQGLVFNPNPLWSGKGLSPFPSTKQEARGTLLHPPWKMGITRILHSFSWKGMCVLKFFLQFLLILFYKSCDIVISQ